MIIAVFASFIATTLVGFFSVSRSGQLPARETSRYCSTARVTIAALVVGVAFFVEALTIGQAARGQRPFPDWLAQLPIIVLDDRAPLYGHAPIGTLIGACTVLQTFGLGVLAYVIGNRRLSKPAAVVVGLVSIAMVATAFVSPAMTSFDLYAYVGSAHVAAPYRPEATAFAGAFAAINSIYGVPILPSPYGPAWIAVSRAVAALDAGLHAQLLGLRALEVLAFAACLGALRMLRVPAASIVVVALNPALALNYILDGHNDLIAIALVLWAIVVARIYPIAGIALGISAGAVKLPFLAIGMLAFARILTGKTRLIACFALVCGGALVYALLGGTDFIHGLATTSHLYRAALDDTIVNGLHVALGLAAIGFIILALVKGRYVATASWSFAALATTFFGWYVPWGIPYALLDRRWFVPFMVSLPALSFILSTAYAPTLLGGYLTFFTLIAAPVAAYVALRRADRDRSSANV